MPTPAELALDFFRRLDPAAIATSRADARRRTEPDRVRDLVYRVFHTSFKMYRAGELAAGLAAAMLAPLGWQPPDEGFADGVLAELRRWGLDAEFLRTFEETVATRWTRERNQPEPWHEDARRLLAGLLETREIALATLEAMDRAARGTGFLWEAGCLDPTDALLLEVWTPLGRVFRYPSVPEVYEQCRKLLVQRGIVPEERLMANRSDD
jgi:hypothetical protein